MMTLAGGFLLFRDIFSAILSRPEYFLKQQADLAWNELGNSHRTM
jgi:hypothetical protein